MQVVQRAAQHQQPVTKLLILLLLRRRLLSLTLALTGRFPLLRLPLRQLILQFLRLPPQTGQLPLETLGLAVAEIAQLLRAVCAPPSPAALASVGLPLGGDAVGEVDIAGVELGPEEACACLVGVDSAPVDV